MKKSFALAGILMLAAISFSTVYAENGEPEASGKEAIAEQNVICPGRGQNSMGQMHSEMQGAMGNCMGGMMNHQMNGNINDEKMVNSQAIDGNTAGHKM